MMEASKPTIRSTGSMGCGIIGDLLIIFHGDDDAIPGRTSSVEWTVERHQQGWKVLLHPVSRVWRGYPFLNIHQEPWHLWLLGELYGCSQDAPACEALLREVVTERKSAAELNGHFLLLAWNDETRQWHLWTDRFGTLHAYYATDGARAAIGTFSPAVAAAASRRELDWVGLTGFFAFGFFPQDRTHFKDVRILRPASHYVFNDDGELVRQERYWNWWHEPNHKRTYEDTVAEFGHVLDEVMADLPHEDRIALPISGGLDSRTTVAVMTQPGFRSSFADHLWPYSYGYSDGSIETRIARQVAAARKLCLHPFTIRPYLFERLERVLAWTEGFQDITQPRQAFVVEDVARHADQLIAALWGDVWLDDMGLVDRQRESIGDELVLQHTIHRIQKYGRKWLLDQLVQPQLGRNEPNELLREVVKEELNRFSHIDDPDFRVKTYKMEQWSFRWSLPPIRVFQAAASPRLVFYDTRLTDFFSTVPSEYVRKRGLQVDYLKRFAPDLARITWQPYDTNLFRYQHFNSWLLPKRALKKAWRIISRKRTFIRNWEVQFLNDRGHEELEQWLLRPGLRLHEFVSPDAVRELLDVFYDPSLDQQRGYGYTISMLLTFSAWLELYA